MEGHLMRVDKDYEPRPHFSLGENLVHLMERLVGVRSKPKFGFPETAVLACRANFEKSYLTHFLLELSCSCTQIEATDV